MRTLAVLLAVAGMALSAHAEKPVTVAELETVLVAAHGHPDDDVSAQLSGLALRTW
jgi:hypothetical protein